MAGPAGLHGGPTRDSFESIQIDASLIGRDSLEVSDHADGTQWAAAANAAADPTQRGARRCGVPASTVLAVVYLLTVFALAVVVLLNEGEANIAPDDLEPVLVYKPDLGNSTANLTVSGRVAFADGRVTLQIATYVINLSIGIRMSGFAAIIAALTAAGGGYRKAEYKRPGPGDVVAVDTPSLAAITLAMLHFLLATSNTGANRHCRHAGHSADQDPLTNPMEHTTKAEEGAA